MIGIYYDFFYWINFILFQVISKDSKRSEVIQQNFKGFQRYFEKLWEFQRILTSDVNKFDRNFKDFEEFQKKSSFNGFYRTFKFCKEFRGFYQFSGIATDLKDCNGLKFFVWKRFHGFQSIGFNWFKKYQGNSQILLLINGHEVLFINYFL